jgi:hypothetical protein
LRCGYYSHRELAGSLYYYESDDDATYRLLSLSEKRFAARGADDFQLEFIVAGDGTVRECHIVWDDGFRITLLRTE